METVTVYSYGGSLILGARDGGHEVIASLEDQKGWGTDVQRLNFPGLRVIAGSPESWKEIDPRHRIVIAHPPCSWASPQNNSSRTTGLQSDAFKCTENVLKYGLGGGAAAVAVESVVGAMEPARQVHGDYAKRYGYRVFRIVVNSRILGVPQDRERFWAVFVKADRLVWGWTEKNRTIRDVMTLTESGGFANEWDAVPGECVDVLSAQMRKWETDGVPDEEIDEVLSGIRGFGMVNGKIAGSREAGRYQLFKFGTRNLRLLNPEGYSNTLLSDSLWAVPRNEPVEDVVGRGCRLVTVGEYCDIMGFPRDYRWSPKQLRGGFRAYLSKGVCPPVASWILEMIELNLQGSLREPHEKEIVVTPDIPFRVVA